MVDNLVSISLRFYQKSESADAVKKYSGELSFVNPCCPFIAFNTSKFADDGKRVFIGKIHKFSRNELREGIYSKGMIDSKGSYEYR